MLCCPMRVANIRTVKTLVGTHIPFCRLTVTSGSMAMELRVHRGRQGAWPCWRCCWRAARRAANIALARALASAPDLPGPAAPLAAPLDVAAEAAALMRGGDPGAGSEALAGHRPYLHYEGQPDHAAVLRGRGLAGAGRPRRGRRRAGRGPVLVTARLNRAVYAFMFGKAVR